VRTIPGPHKIAGPAKDDGRSLIRASYWSCPSWYIAAAMLPIIMVISFAFMV
jgi:hypothetical protein